MLYESKQENLALTTELDQVKAELQELKSRADDTDDIKLEYKKLQAEHDQLSEKYSDSLLTIELLKEENQNLKVERDRLKSTSTAVGISPEQIQQAKAEILKTLGMGTTAPKYKAIKKILDNLGK